MPKLPRRKHRITLREAQDLVRRYRNFTREHGGAFAKEEILRLLDYPGAAGLRIWYGLHEDGSPAPVLVAVDADHEDLLEAGILEQHMPCPPYCARTSPLGPQGRAGRARRRSAQ